MMFFTTISNALLVDAAAPELCLNAAATQMVSRACGPGGKPISHYDVLHNHCLPLTKLALGAARILVGVSPNELPLELLVTMSLQLTT